MNHQNYLTEDIQAISISAYKDYFSEIKIIPEEAIINILRKARKICPTGGSYHPFYELPSLEEAEEFIHQSKIFCTWFNCAKTLPIPFKLTLADAFRNRPGYSPGYFGNPDIPIGTSPHRLQEWTWKVWRRANQILQPYGWKVSWYALEAAIHSHSLRRVGKVAVQVAAASLPVNIGGGLQCASRLGGNGPSKLHSLRESRLTLINARGWAKRPIRQFKEVFNELLNEGCTVQSALTEIEFISNAPQDSIGHIQGQIIHSKQHIQIRRDYSCNYEGVLRIFGYVVIATGYEPYHSSAYSIEYSIKDALTAWKKQRAIKKADNKIASLLAQNDRTYFARLEDSIAVGNCSIGTRHFAETNGFKNAIPLNFLINSADHRAVNVAHKIANEVIA